MQYLMDLNVIKKKKKKNKNETKKKDKSINNFVEIKLLIEEKKSNKTYFKLLTLELTPFYNNYNSHFIIFNGTYFLNQRTIISVLDLTHRNEQNEIVLGFSNPNLENIVESNPISLKKYISWQSILGNKLTKIISFKIIMKLYNIYKLEKIYLKEIKKIDSIKNKIKIKESENISEEQISNDQIKTYNEVNSVLSSVQTSSFSKQINGIRVNKIKKDNIIDYSILNLIKKVIYLFFILVLVIIIFEDIYYRKLMKTVKNSHNSYRNYRGFYRLYYQLFSSILAVACIPEKIESKNCRNYISIFNKVYSRNYPDKSFDFTEHTSIILHTHITDLYER